MVLFKNKDDSPDNWKEKYFALLASQDRQEEAYKANEELLCKTIIRFALAVKGLNKALDPHISRIRNSLKSGLQSQQLQNELEAFSSALIVLEDEPDSSHVDAGILFNFLYTLYPDRKSLLEAIQERHQRHEFPNSQGLFIGLLELIDEKPTGNVGSAAGLTVAEHQIIRTHLLRLLDDAEIPEKFAAEAEQIKARLQIETNEESLGPIIGETVNLLLDVKKHLAMQESEMADFLSKLTDELAELAIRASGVNIATENALKSRNLLNQNLSQQMVDLQNKSASATQLEPLKQLVHGHLSSISQQIQTHNRQEQIQRESLQLELKALTHKVYEMETESAELKSKLEIAQHNATRDPLTNLPNRLAFEERLNFEMARWRRNNALPLSMVVWDIDYFKKINDKYGHKSGDKALIVIAQLLDKKCRQTDFVARFGGEEFVMLLPDTDARTALNVADKLRGLVEKASFKADGDKISITLSCGISQLLAGDSNESIFERADKALYQAKQNGRNQCVVL